MHSRESALQILTDAILARHSLVAGSAEIELSDIMHGADGQHTLTWASYIARDELRPFPVAYGAVRLLLWPYEGMEPRFAWFDMALAER